MLGKFIKRLLSPEKARHNDRLAAQSDGTSENTMAGGIERGRQHFKQGEFGAAETCFRAALKQGNSDGTAHFYLCVTLQRQNRLIESLRSGLLALAYQPDNKIWLDSIKFVSVDVGKAEGVATSLLEADQSGDCAALISLGNALRETGQLDAAVDAYLAATQKMPESPFAWRRLGGLLAARGQFEKADDCFRISEEQGLTPDHLIHLRNTALALLDRERNSPGLPTGASLPNGFGSADTQESADELVLLVSGDPTYVRRFGRALAESAFQHMGSRCIVHIHVVNPVDGLLDEIDRWRHSHAAIATSSEVIRDLEDPRGDLARTHYACARFRLLPDILRYYDRTVLVLDLDMLVMSDPTLVIETTRDSDVALLRWHETRWDPWDTLSASVSLYRPTAAARRFAVRTANYIDSILSPDSAHRKIVVDTWFLDQIALFAAFASSSEQGDCRIAWLPTETLRVASSLDENPTANSASEISPFWTIAFHVHDRPGFETPAAFSSKAAASSVEAATYFSRGVDAYRKNSLVEAEACFSQTIALAPRHADALLYRGACLVNMGRSFEAARDALLARSIAPTRNDWLNAIKDIVDRVGCDADLDTCTRDVREHDDSIAYLGLGACLHRAGDMAGAESALRKAVERKPDSPFVLRRLASLLTATGQDDEADALYQRSARAGLRPDRMLRLSHDWLAETLLLASQISTTLADDDAGIPALHWHAGIELPRQPLVVYASGDPGYLRRFAYPLINSIARHGNEPCIVHLHAINPDEGLLESIMAMGKALGVMLACTWERAPTRAGVAARTYYACARFLQLPTLMTHYRSPLVVLDLDQLVVGELSHLRNAVKDADVGLLQWHSSLYDPWDRFWASLIWFSPSKPSHQFARLMAAYIARFVKDGTLYWYLDQCAMFATHAWAIRHETLIAHLPPTLAHLAEPGPRAFAPPGTVVWSAIASLAEKEPLFSARPFTDYLPRRSD